MLVFDDPAMGLDVPTRRELLEQMIDQLGSGGTSVLFTSHIFSDIERMADRIGILHDGELIVNAPLEDLKRRVSRVFMATPTHSSVQAMIESQTRVLSCRPRSNGYDVTCLDHDAILHRALTGLGTRASEPVSVALEDLFIEMTTQPSSTTHLQAGGE